eukprot:TRINITY_DN31211_c0_g1_i1.p1 TRINITY_DN31211_c0_g1~~TRINITY_DN31211_c0_g1_i1.p1  ORF type:complete len:219 (-),score=41.60 TRINITY_DN31211_c0_g1_i1:193-849(-)
MAGDMSADLEELRHLHSLAKRPRIRSILSSQIQDMEKAQQAASQNSTPKPVSTQSVAARNPDISYTTLGSFSWDQDNEKVKVYLFIEGADSEKVVSNFQAWSFDVKLHDVQGKNYRCGVPKLHKAIVPEQCSIVVKPQRIIISLKKAEKGHWQDIYYKEDKFKPKLDENKDPMAGIMDLMKNMYEEGDDDMKRTIAKAWTEARSGKKSDPLKGFDNDM